MGLLQQAGLATVYVQDIAGLNPLLNAMSARGMPIDLTRQAALAHTLEKTRAHLVAQMQDRVPPEVHRWKRYKKKPDVMLPFTPSNLQMKRYARFKGYRLPSVTDRFTGVSRETANEVALRRLVIQHPEDALLPLILQYREIEKLASTYVGRVA